MYAKLICSSELPSLVLYSDTVLEVLEERTQHLNPEAEKTEVAEPESS